MNLLKKKLEQEKSPLQFSPLMDLSQATIQTWRICDLSQRQRPFP